MNKFDIPDDAKDKQRQKILDALRENATQTTSDLRDGQNVLMPAARIFELRRDGWTISTRMVWAADSEGRMHRQAEYRLMEHGKENAA